MTINIENLDTLIKHLKSLKNPSTFDMGTYGDFNPRRLKSLDIDTGAKLAKRLVREGDCQTAACIAGHALYLAEPDRPLYHDEFDGELDYADSAYSTARHWLGLDVDQADALFTPFGYSHGSVPLKLAVRVLENLRDTVAEDEPKVDWEEAESQLRAEAAELKTP